VHFRALAVADHVDYLVAGQRAPGSPKRTKALAGVNPPLDGPVVLLQDIIEVRHPPVLAAGVQRSFTRDGMVLLTQGFGQEALCCARVLLGREEEVEGPAGGVHRPIQVAPLAFDPYVGFVYPPTALVGLSLERKRRSIAGA
jgi:hypothetical protein